jgi:hypothetical protein
MIKSWQLRALTVSLAFGIPLASSCAREANTLDGEETPDGGGKTSAGTTSKAGTIGKAGTGTSAFGGTTGNGGSGGSSSGGEAPAEGGDSGTIGGKGGTGGTSTTVPPDVLARASAVVYYQTSHATASDKIIQMKLSIKNQSADPLPMANVKIRYWFTAEAVPELHQYYTGPEAQMPKAAFVDDAADSHVLMTFGGGSIVMGGDMNASEIQLEITNNLSPFDQSDDFSWAPTSATATPNGKITLYLDDTLIWGCEPSGACFDDATGAGGAGAGGAAGATGAAGAAGAAGAIAAGGAP